MPIFLSDSVEPIDLAQIENVEIVVKHDGKTLWVNCDLGCILRICQIRGQIVVTDQRKRNRRRYANYQRAQQSIDK